MLTIRADLVDAMNAAVVVDGTGGELLQLRDAYWLLSFLCGDPSDYAFDSISGILDRMD